MNGFLGSFRILLRLCGQRFLWNGSYFLALLLGNTSAPLHAQEWVDMLVGYSAISASQAAPWIMQDAGLLEKHHLNAKLVYIPTTKLAVAIVSGDIKIAQNNGVQVVDAVLAGADSVFVGGTSNSLHFYLMVSPGINSIEDLRGKSMGITRFRSSTDFAARLLLKKYGLVPGKDVTLYQTGGHPESLAAMQAGVIKATLVSSPSDLRARALGYKELMDTAKMEVPFQSTGIVTTRAYLKQQRDAVRRYLMAYIEGLHLLFTDKRLAISVIKKYTRTTDPKMLDMTYDYAKKIVERVPRPTLEGIQLVLDVIGEVNPKAKDYKPADFVDMSLMQELEKEGFIRKVWGQ
jgi:ABC-type nitrate/sulfonate/bicarbonate transport system substrate-binding protein